MKKNLKQLATRWVALLFAASLVITNVDLLLFAEGELNLGTEQSEDAIEGAETPEGGQEAVIDNPDSDPENIEDGLNLETQGEGPKTEGEGTETGKVGDTNDITAETPGENSAVNYTTSGNNDGTEEGTETASGNNVTSDSSSNDVTGNSVSENDLSANDVSSNDISSNDMFADVDFEEIQEKIDALPTLDEIENNLILLSSEGESAYLESVFTGLWKEIGELLFDEYKLVTMNEDASGLSLNPGVDDRLNIKKFEDIYLLSIGSISLATDAIFTLTNVSAEGTGIDEKVTATISVTELNNETSLTYKVLNRVICDHVCSSDNNKYHQGTHNDITGSVSVSDNTITITDLKYGDHVAIMKGDGTLFRFKVLAEELLNGSFEIKGTASGVNNKQFYETGDAYAWHTTATNGQIEIYDGYGALNTDGKFASELCGFNEKSSLYQEVKTSDGEVMSWSLRHALRSQVADTMAVVIGPAMDISDTSKNYSGYTKTDANTKDMFMEIVNQLGTLDNLKLNVEQTVQYNGKNYYVYLIQTSTTALTTYSGTYTVPTGQDQTETVFAFVAIGTKGSLSADMTSDYGNLLDAITFGKYKEPVVSYEGITGSSDVGTLKESLTVSLNAQNYPADGLTYEVVNRQNRKEAEFTDETSRQNHNSNRNCDHGNVTGSVTYENGAASITGLKYGDHVVVKSGNSIICRFKVLSNKLLNGSFEKIDNVNDKLGNLRTGESMYAWHTTASDRNMEWGVSYEGNVAPANGSYIVELNANEVASLYQEVGADSGDKLEWSVSHRGRTGVDEMAIVVGPALSVGDTDVYRKSGVSEKEHPDIFQRIVSLAKSQNNNSLTTGNTYTVEYDGKTYQVVIASDNCNEWKAYYGTYTVPDGVTEVVFGFTSIESSSGDQGAGNLIDAVSFGIYEKPAVSGVTLGKPSGTGLTEAITATLTTSDYSEYANLTYEVTNRQWNCPGSHNENCVHTNVTGTVNNSTKEITGLKYGDHVAVKYNDEIIYQFKVLSDRLLNGSLEINSYQYAANSTYTSGRTGEHIYAWHTTASDANIELWTNGIVGSTSYDQKYYSELAACEPSSLYQEIKATPGDKLSWGVAHCGRAGVDEMAIVVGPAKALSKDGVDEYKKTNSNETDFFAAIVAQAKKEYRNLKTGETYYVEYDNTEYQVTVVKDGKNSWKRYTGTYTVPRGVTEVVFGFSAISSSESNLQNGNLLDAVSFGIYSDPKVSGVESISSPAYSDNNDKFTENVTAKLSIENYPEYGKLTYEVTNRQGDCPKGSDYHINTYPGNLKCNHENINGQVNNDGTISGLKYGDHVTVSYEGKVLYQFKVLSTELLNGSFETVRNIAVHPQNDWNGSIKTGTNIYGWHTTASDKNIELHWGRFLPAKDGKIHAELNANEFSSLYQEVSAKEGDILDWSIAHSGGKGEDTMAIVVGPALPNGTEYTKANKTDTDFFAAIVAEAKKEYENLARGKTYRISYQGNTYQVTIARDTAKAWKTYSGSYTVPEGVNEVVFGFSAISAAENDTCAGNLIDAVSFCKSTRVKYVGHTVTGGGNEDMNESLLAEVEMTNYTSGDLKYVVTNRKDVSGNEINGELTLSDSNDNKKAKITGLKYGDHVAVTDASGNVQFYFKVLSDKLLNGSFEINDGTSVKDESGKTVSTSIKTGANLYAWHTTASDANMKLAYTGNAGISANDENYYAGLTAVENASLYQEIDTRSNKSIAWSLTHAGDGDKAQMAVVIGPALDASESYTKTSSTSNDIFMDIAKKAANGNPEANKTYSVEYNGNTYCVLFTDTEKDWTAYSGLYTAIQDETVVAYVPYSGKSLVDAVGFEKPNLTVSYDVSDNDLIIKIDGVDTDKNNTKYAVLDKDGNVVKKNITVTKNEGTDEVTGEDGWFNKGTDETIKSLTFTLKDANNGPYTVVRTTATSPSVGTATKIGKANVISLSRDGGITWYADEDCTMKITGFAVEALDINAEIGKCVFFKVDDPTDVLNTVSSYVDDGGYSKTRIKYDKEKKTYSVTYEITEDESRTLTVIKKTDSKDAVTKDEGGIIPNIPWSQKDTIGDIVVKDESSSATVNTDDMFNVIYKDRKNLTDEDITVYGDGGKIEFIFKAKENYNVSNNTHEKVELLLAGKTEGLKDLDGYKDGQYLDIQIIKNVYLDKDGSNKIESSNITNLENAIKITVDIPTYLRNRDSLKDRSYKVIRIHNDENAELTTEYNKENQTLSFYSDKFSDYVILYKDTEKSSGDSGNSGGNNDSDNGVIETIKDTVGTAVTTIATNVKNTFGKKKASAKTVDASDKIKKDTEEATVSGNTTGMDADKDSDKVTEDDMNTDADKTTDTVTDSEAGNENGTDLISGNPEAGDNNKSDSWALVNLLAMLATAVIAIARLPKALKDRSYLKLAGLVPMIIATVLFFITEDLSGSLGFVDGWTIVMILLLAIEAGLSFIKGKENR